MSDIFICYSRTDSNAAKHVQERLRAQGWSVFLDVHVGKRWHAHRTLETVSRSPKYLCTTVKLRGIATQDVVVRDRIPVAVDCAWRTADEIHVGFKAHAGLDAGGEVTIHHSSKLMQHRRSAAFQDRMPTALSSALGLRRPWSALNCPAVVSAA